MRAGRPRKVRPSGGNSLASGAPSTQVFTWPLARLQRELRAITKTRGRRPTGDMSLSLADAGRYIGCTHWRIWSIAHGEQCMTDEEQRLLTQFFVQHVKGTNHGIFFSSNTPSTHPEPDGISAQIPERKPERQRPTQNQGAHGPDTSNEGQLCFRETSQNDGQKSPPGNAAANRAVPWFIEITANGPRLKR